MSAPVLDALDTLESEAIHIFREVAGEFDRPVILFSGGKDSTLLVHLAAKAFAPAAVQGGRAAMAGRPCGARVTTMSQEHVLLALARMAMDASVRAADEIGGLSPVQLRALTALRQLGEANLAQLAAEMGVTVSTTSRLVDRLVAADRVHRAPSANNRREISLTLTDGGIELLRRFDERRVEVLKECLDRLPGERQAGVIRALAELAGVAHS